MKLANRGRCGVLIAVASTVGCGGLPASVSGVVTVDGKPLNRGSVSFHPVGDGQTAIGAIGSDGSYDLMTGREEGLGVGEYQAAVVAREMQETGGGGPPMQGKFLAPKRYSLVQSSGLKYTVEKGSNEINIELTSEGDEPGPK